MQYFLSCFFTTMHPFFLAPLFPLHPCFLSSLLACFLASLFCFTYNLITISFMMQRLSKIIGSSLADEEKYIKTQKRIRMLESKIENSVQRFDKTLARNAAHRQSIKLITQDRTRFACKSLFYNSSASLKYRISSIKRPLD